MKGKVVAGIVLALVLLPAVLVAAEDNELLEGPKISISRDDLEDHVFLVTSHDEILAGPKISINEGDKKGENNEGDTLDNDDVRIIVDTPSAPSIAGPTSGRIGVTYKYYISSVDPQDDMVSYKIRFSDCPALYCSEFYPSGQNVQISHTWDTFYQKSGPYQIYITAVDQDGHQSQVTVFTVDITVRFSDVVNDLRTSTFFENVLNMFPILEEFF